MRAPIHTGGCESYRAIVEKYDWDTRIAMAVMKAESTCIPTNHNYSDETGDDSWGLFQINLYGNLKLSRPTSSWLVEPENNIAHAYKMWRGGGWSQWGAYTSGKYLEHL